MAIECQRRGLQIARETQMPDVEIVSLIGLAVAECQLNQRDDAAAHALQALESARKIGYRVYEGKALTVLAEIRLAQGLHEEARDHAGQAVDNHRATGHRPGEASAHAALGSALDQLGDPHGLEHWRQAREILTAMGAPVPDELAEAG